MRRYIAEDRVIQIILDHTTSLLTFQSTAAIVCVNKKLSNCIYSYIVRVFPATPRISNEYLPKSISRVTCVRKVDYAPTEV
jgi:hypothetical protein